MGIIMKYPPKLPPKSAQIKHMPFAKTWHIHMVNLLDVVFIYSMLDDIVDRNI